jgi:hypothetical protein
MSLVRERIQSQSSYLVFLLEVPERRLSAGQLELDLEPSDPLVWSQTELEHPPSPAQLAEADLHLEPEDPLPEQGHQPLADRLAEHGLDLLEPSDPQGWSLTELEHPPSPARLAEADLHLEPEGPLPEPLADRLAEPGLDLLEPWVPLGWSLPELQHQPFAGRLPEAPLDLQREEVDQRLSRQTFSGWLKKKVRINYIWFLKYQLPSTQQQLNETILKRD